MCFGSFSSKPESTGDEAFAVEAAGASGALGAVENPVDVLNLLGLGASLKKLRRRLQDLAKPLYGKRQLSAIGD